MEFDLAEQRAGAREQLRIADLMSLAPGRRPRARDRGEGLLSVPTPDRSLQGGHGARSAETRDRRAGNRAVQGDVTALDFADGSFDTVFCTEVLEHVPPQKLRQACGEIARVASRWALIGVPYRQDLRANRTRCARCGAVNPTTGHLSRFDRGRLEELFPGMEVRDARLVGRGQAVTNPLSVFLYRLCGYPYGSYAQEEGCVHCGAKLVRPEIGPLKWAVCFPARALNRIQYLLYGRRRPLWIHVLFEKKDANRIKTE